MRGPARCMVVGILALVILSVTFIQFTQQGDESIFRHRFGGLGPKAGQPQGDATFRPPFQTVPVLTSNAKACRRALES